MAQRLLHRLLLAISFDNPNGTATVTQTSFGNFFWQSQWHSDCYTDFSWQSFLTIPMAQRLLHRLLLTIFFDNPNGTATVTQTSLDNLFWQSQWHSDCYTDFFWQFLLTIPMAQQLLHRLLLAISFDNPNGTATVTQTSFGNFFWQSQWHSDCYTDFFWQFRLTIPMAQRLLHRLLLAISFDNPNGTATVTQTSFGNFFWQSQWHSDCYTDFFWQFLLTIPMAQRLLHRLLLAISFDNPNGTATVTQTSFGNLFWQSQWHSMCHIVFVDCPASQFLMAPQPLHRVLLTHQDVTIPMAQRVPSSFWKPLYLQCFSSYTRPSDQTQRPRLVLVKGPCSQPANTLHPNAKVLATCPLDWHFPMEGRRYNLKSGRTLQQSTSQWNASDAERTQKCKTKSVLHTTAMPWAHKLVTKAQRMQTKAQKQQKYCAQQQNMMHELPPDKKKSSKHCGHTS